MKPIKRLFIPTPSERLRLKRLEVAKAWAAGERERVRNFRVIRCPERAKGK